MPRTSLPALGLPASGLPALGLAPVLALVLVMVLALPALARPRPSAPPGQPAAPHGSSHIARRQAAMAQAATIHARAERRKAADPPPQPLSFRIGAATFTPGGFVDLTSVWRSRDMTGTGTNFAAVPFAGTPAGSLSAFGESAQNSRLDLMVRAHPGREQVTAYVEADFLGAAPSNVQVTSHSNTLRMRLYWVDVRRGGWEVLAGQSWSLLTPNRRGLSPLPSNVFFTEDMDTNYQAGLVWSRDPQVRLIRHFNRHWTLGVSLENPDPYIGPAVTLPDPAYASQFDNGANASAPSSRPDIIAKLAYDGHWGGHRVHAEVAGLSSSFQAVNPASLVATGGSGAGGELDGNIELWPHLDLLLNGYYSDGGGRYIFGLAPDFIVSPGGRIQPLHSASTVDGIEWRFAPQWLAYGYYGAVAIGRDYAFGLGGPVGYGFPGGSDAANRTIQEGTAGLIRTLWKHSGYGALEVITQYSYLTRAPWWTAPTRPRTASMHMVYADLRYVLP